jgi:hypothetical protein
MFANNYLDKSNFQKNNKHERKIKFQTNHFSWC